MNQKFRSLLTLALMTALAAPALAQEAAPAPAEAAPAAAPTEAAPAPDAAPAPEAAPAAAAPAEATAPAAQPVAPPPAEDEAGENQCVLGKLCFGPVLTLGLFNPLGIGVHARYGDYFGFGIDYQFLPSITVSGAGAGIGLLTIDGRIYPFGGAFFLSGGLAFQSASFTAKASTSAGKEDIDGTISIPAFKLGLGFMGHDGFVMGIDLAFGIPLGSSDVEFDTHGLAKTDPEIAKAMKDIEDGADVVVKALPVLFQLNLLRIGYLF
jgi:hypothetical protein